MDESTSQQASESNHGEPRKRAESIVTWLLVRIAATGGGLCALATLISFFGSVHWFAELFTNFPVQYFGGLLVSGVGLIVLARKRSGGFFVALGFINACFFLPVYLPARAVPSSDSHQQVRIISSNVLTSNPNRQAAIERLREADADIMVLLEVDQTWLDDCQALADEYPYQLVFPQDDNFGMAIFSKLEPAKSEKLAFGDWQIPTLKMEFNDAGNRWALIAAHPVPPVNTFYAQERNRYLAELADEAKGITSSLVVVGDFNLSPYSPYFRRLLASTGLRDSRQGFGIQPSWPVESLLLRIPIDHCFLRGAVQVRNRSLMPVVGSDHFPILIDLELPSPPATTNLSKNQ